MPSKQLNNTFTELKAIVRTKAFLYNLIAAIVAIVLFFWILSFILEAYTHHGQMLAVPNLKGVPFDKVKTVLANTTFEYAISDSTYRAGIAPMAVIDQTPEPDQKVKEGRTIYLTVNSRRVPMVKMPELRDNSLKQATLELESYGLTLGQIIYRPDIAKDVVLDQLYYNQTAAFGREVPKGAVIDLVVGNGLGETTSQVPNLMGLTVSEARGELKMQSLSLGAVLEDKSVKGDTVNAVVYRQSPPFGATADTIRAGETVDIYITKDKDKMPVTIQKTENDTTDDTQ